MNSLSGSWKKLLILISAGFLLLFVSRHSGSQGAAAAERPSPAATAVEPENGPPPSNEISDFQQLD